MEDKKALGEPVLVVEDLQVRFELEAETVSAVNGISFTLKKGHTLGFVGETGAGKTTTALSLLRLVPHPGKVESKKIEVCGQEVSTMTTQQLEKYRGNDIAMIF